MRDELIVSLAVCRFFFSNKTHTHPFHTQVMPSYTCRKICIRILRIFGKVKQTVYLLCESRWCRYPFIMLFQDAPVSYPPTTLVSFISTNNACYVKTIRITEEEEKKNSHHRQKCIQLQLPSNPLHPMHFLNNNQTASGKKKRNEIFSG